jgi:hypothetical protein
LKQLGKKRLAEKDYIKASTISEKWPFFIVMEH